MPGVVMVPNFIPPGSRWPMPDKNHLRRSAQPLEEGC